MQEDDGLANNLSDFVFQARVRENYLWLTVTNNNGELLLTFSAHIQIKK